MREIDLTDEIAAFEAQRAHLRQVLGSKWIVMVDDQCAGAFAEFDEAAQFALESFRDRGFLIRHVDAEEPQIPLVVVENP